MKYNITIIVLILFLIVGQIFNSYYTLFFGIVTVGLIYLTVFLWEFSIFKIDFDSDYKFRSHKKDLDLYNLFIALIWTVFIVTQDNLSEFDFFMIISFWSLPIIEILIWFIYKAKRPFTVFIKDDELILNKRWYKVRNLPNLVQISYNRFTKSLLLDFKVKSEISIATTEYSTEDINLMLKILIEKSEHNVFIPSNYKPNNK